jgi:integrase
LITSARVDYISKTITLNTPEKGSNPRIFSVSDKLLGMLLYMKNTSQIKDKNRIFQRRIDHIRRQYQRTKLRLAEKLQNPRLKRIMLKTFRTWKATTLYHQTKDPWYVMEFLGHRSLQHTRVYVQLEASLFTAENDEWHCKAAKTPDEAVELVERGFEFVNQIGTVYLYRKRK